MLDVEEGALLPSPTREKLMPAIPRSKADSPQRGSPQKTATSRHGSPLKGSPQKSPKKLNKGEFICQFLFMESSFKCFELTVVDFGHPLQGLSPKFTISSEYCLKITKNLSFSSNFLTMWG